MTIDEFFEEALYSFIQRAEENQEYLKQICLESQKYEDLEINTIRCYPVYVGETEAQALDRRLQEEIDLKE